MSQITDTIYRQITFATKMACGARDFVSGDQCNVGPFGLVQGKPFLWFRVGGNHKLLKIVVAYDRGKDAYNVLYIDINRRNLLVTVLEQAEEVYVESLNDVIYRMVNK